MAAFDIANDEYTFCKQWIAKQIQAGHSWEDVKRLCVSLEKAKSEFGCLQNGELTIPFDISFYEWGRFIGVVRSSHTLVVEMYGL